MTVNILQSVEWQEVQVVLMGFIEERISPDDRDELSRRLAVLEGRPPRPALPIARAVDLDNCDDDNLS